jgi:hypothetical protein
MYGIESSVLHVYLHDVDIILYINNIDNPLSIKEGMLLRYPPIGDMDKFRYTPTDSTSSINITKQLGFKTHQIKLVK